MARGRSAAFLKSLRKKYGLGEFSGRRRKASKTVRKAVSRRRGKTQRPQVKSRRAAPSRAKLSPFYL